MVKAETVAKALTEIEKGYAQYQYFFDSLNSPAWLGVLSEKGFFKSPPAPVRDGQYISFSVWPESRYLVRMARIAPAQDLVLRIALAIPPNENSRVHDDIAAIALSLPASQSAKLIPQICAAIPNAVKLLLAGKLGELIVHLARGHEGQAALQLTSAALALTPDPRLTQTTDDPSLLLPEPKTYFDTWYYNRIVDQITPDLVKSSGLGAIRLFCTLLDQSIRFSQKREQEGTEDYIYIKHPAIEHGKDHQDIPTLLLIAVRDAAEQLINTKPDEFHSVINIFEDYKWITFRRLELHLFRVFLEHSAEIADRVFQTPNAIRSASLRHEAVLLLRAVFPRLRLESRDRILAWMDAGPSEEDVRQWLEWTSQQVTEESIQELIDRQRLEELAILEGQLPDQYRQIYEALEARFGTPRPADQVVYTRGGAISPQAPRSADELAAMPISEILEFVQSWVPDNNGIFGPTAEGLGVAFQAAVSRRPSEFASASTAMKGFDPTYMRHFFAAFTESLKCGENWNWEPVLSLAKWVVDQGREIPGRKGGLFFTDPDWGWTRNTIIDLLSAALENSERLSLEMRNLVWGVIKPLTHDPNPRLEDEAGDKFDPSFLSINSTRGRALDAVIEYARWLRRCSDSDRVASGQPPMSFESMPEVEEVLDAHLDTSTEPTLTIRSVYGRNLTSLAGLDLEWLRGRISKLFPLGQDDAPLFAAAWDSFLAFNHPNKSLLPLLIPAYKEALARITQPRGSMKHPDSPENRIAEHVMIYYWLGIIDFGSSDLLLNVFYSQAPDKLRGRSLWFVGTSVREWKEEAPPEVYERLRQLAERRLEVARNAYDKSPFFDEISNLGWWFFSEKFGEAWSLKTLHAALKITGKAEGSYFITKLLASRCSRYPVECVDCLRLMIEGDHDSWLMLGVEDDARELLRQALRSENPQAVFGAQRLVESLIARGFFGFRSLLM